MPLQSNVEQLVWAYQPFISCFFILHKFDCRIVLIHPDNNPFITMCLQKEFSCQHPPDHGFHIERVYENTFSAHHSLFFDPPVAGHRGVTPCTFSLAVDSFACDRIESRTRLSSCFQEYFSWWGVTEVVQNVVHMDFQTLPFAELLNEFFGLLSLSVEIVWWAAFQQRWLSSKIICHFLSQSLCIVWWCNWNWCL